ncbi:hypothetical protein SAY86_007058 [Trapa natans]|uniref:Major facilitator superfamily (MFS) profile domain-containing protein n=1 Tax=Trapa natans TaxID=22666 RepID=A0AAN7LEA2_TRANT|nr:hypothetical protein SAY86_007058 [Trapa natans]
MPPVGGIVTNGNKAYPGNLTPFVLVTCIVAAMGGLIFGYDIGISGGVTTMDTFLSKFFPSVYRKNEASTDTNQYCKYNSQTLTMFTSSLYLAGLLASLVASTVTRKLGRRSSMLFGGVLFCAGAIINCFAHAIIVAICIGVKFGVDGTVNDIPKWFVTDLDVPPGSGLEMDKKGGYTVKGV